MHQLGSDMRFIVRSFGHATQTGSMAIEAPNGLFEVDDPTMKKILEKLSYMTIVDRSELEIFLSDITDNDLARDYLDFLITKTGVLKETKLQNISHTWIYHEDNVKNAMESNWPDHNTRRKDKKPTCFIILCFDSDFPERIEETINNKISEMSYCDRIISVFQSRDSIIITPPWRKQSAHPCPICHLDMAYERVAFNTDEVMMGLSDVAEILKSKNYDKMPNLPIEQDILILSIIIARRMAKRIGAQAGNLIRPVDPHSAEVISIESMQTHSIRVPLSPRCSCIRETS